MASAPACDPFPPMTKRKSRSISCTASTISATSDPPLLLPKMDPPFRWIVSTTADVKLIGSLKSPSRSTNPLKPYFMPLMSLTPYSSKVITSCLMTSFKPGHRPPHVTIAALHLDGSK